MQSIHRNHLGSGHSFCVRKQAQLSHCSDGVDDTPMLDDSALVIDPDYVDGLHFEGLSGSRHVRDESAFVGAPVRGSDGNLVAGATMSWISAVMSGDAAKKMRYESIAPFLSGVVPGNT